MDCAIDEHSELKGKSYSCEGDSNPVDRIISHDVDMITETREAMRAYFRYTAHYIVVASEYMRDDQLSGGTQIDEGRIW